MVGVVPGLGEGCEEMTDRDWKEFLEPALGHDPAPFDDTIRTTVCPSCGRWVGALVIDGPDPVFTDLRCPRTDVCGLVWSERAA